MWFLLFGGREMINFFFKIGIFCFVFVVEKSFIVIKFVVKKMFLFLLFVNVFKCFW